MKTIAALSILLTSLSLFGKATNETYTVTVWAGGELKLTNCIAITKCTADCTLVRYIERGKTNEFHAWMVPIHVETNKDSRIK